MKPDNEWARPCQQGFTLWEMALVLVVLGVALLVGIASVNAPVKLHHTQNQQRLLRWADSQIAGFAAIHGRLPCPDTSGNGLENCGNGASKGALPYQTLHFRSTMPGRGIPQLRYVAFNGLSGDLNETSTTRYQPSKWEQWGGGGDNSRYTGSGLDNANDLDLCAALVADSATPPQSQFAHIQSGKVVTENIAYGLAAPGAGALVKGSLFEGINAKPESGLEVPGKAPDTNYNDLVRIRTFDSLASSLACSPAMQSVNAIGLASGVVSDILSQKKSLVQSTDIAVGMAAVGDALEVLEIADAISSLVDGVADTGKAATVLAAAIVTCIVGVGCAEIAQATTAVGFGIAGIAAGAVAIGLDTGAAAALAAATAYATEAQLEATGTENFKPVSGKQSAAFWAKLKVKTGLAKTMVAIQTTVVQQEKTDLTSQSTKVINTAEKYRYTTNTKYKAIYTDNSGNKHTTALYDSQSEAKSKCPASTQSCTVSAESIKVNKDPCAGSNKDCKPGPVLQAALTAAADVAQKHAQYANSISGTKPEKCDKLSDTSGLSSTDVTALGNAFDVAGQGLNDAFKNPHVQISPTQYLSKSYIQQMLNNRGGFSQQGQGAKVESARQRCLDKLKHKNDLKKAYNTALDAFDQKRSDVAHAYGSGSVCVLNTGTKEEPSLEAFKLSNPLCEFVPDYMTRLAFLLTQYKLKKFRLLEDQYKLEQSQQELDSDQQTLKQKKLQGAKTGTGSGISIYTGDLLQVLKKADQRGAIQ